MAQKAADAYRGVGDQAARTKAVKTVGVAHFFTGDYRSALAKFDTARGLFRRVFGNDEVSVFAVENGGNP